MIPLSQHVTERLNHLEEIYTVFRKNQIMFSKTEAIKIVGGRGTLERLVAAKKIRMEKRDVHLGRWECNGEDVLRYANFREKEKYVLR
ncbi:hypothetical protein [Parabacteroides pacaensis]|uniref:hypothetical protein n=1 Tax=Parabacteroides pacaensis TaxID=2086575 RepID=UPI001F174A69|nr:hypothetical protein [Parabacteroides pacaensis]